VRRLWAKPVSLATRVMGAVFAAFMGVFAVLLVVMVVTALANDSGDLDRALRDAAKDLRRGVESVGTDDGARAIIAVYKAQNIDDPQKDVSPALYLILARRDGSLRLNSDGAPELDLSQLAEGIDKIEHQSVKYRSYRATGPHWTVIIIDNAKARELSVVRELGSELAFYLALSLPIVLLPVWWAVRSGLAPLQRLSDQVAARVPDDMNPLPTESSYRELLPLQRALNLQFARAADLIRREKAFVHDAAHELRTPLAVINTQAHVLAQSQGESRVTAGRHLEEAVARASHLAQQLLRLARADAAASRMEQPTAEIDLMDLLRDLMAGLADMAAEQQTELDLDGPDHCLLRADPQLMRSVVINLIDNALRYAGPGGMVEVSLHRAGGFWQLRVADRGPGVESDLHEKAFERFWRGAPDASPGSGLGLAIVREAARSLGGTAWLQAREGGGCIACVEWPASP